MSEDEEALGLILCVCVCVCVCVRVRACVCESKPFITVTAKIKVLFHPLSLPTPHSISLTPTALPHRCHVGLPLKRYIFVLLF